MPKKDALNVYVADGLVATEMLPVISYQAAEQFFHTVCELLNFKNITIRENKHRKGAICSYNPIRDTHRIEIGRCTKLTENLIREFLPSNILEKWNYYNFQVQKLRTKDQIEKFYWNRIDEIQRVS